LSASEEIMSLVNRHLNKLLTIAEAALPHAQFRAFRKAALDEFGRNGLETEIRDLTLRMERAGFESGERMSDRSKTFPS